MTERKLATIQRVKDLIAIAGADKIELAIINGWQVVTQKGQHSVGDLVVFYEIDSWLPADDPRYDSFAERFTNWGDKRGMRLKTIKLRKQLSQGLIMPVRNFPELTQVGDGKREIAKLLKEGDDVTEILKIEKWEPIEKDIPGRQVQAQGEKRFPAFIPKTDQARIQNIGEIVLSSIDEEFEATMKKDGSSMTVFAVVPGSEHYAAAKALYEKKLTLWQNVAAKLRAFFSRKQPDATIYGICSRNILLPLEGNSNFHTAAEDVMAGMNLAELSREVKSSYAIQGEVVAPDIQDNYEKVSSVEFHVFDVYNIDSQKYLTPEQRHNVVELLGLSHATVVAEGKLRDILSLPNEGVTADDVVKAALTYASGPGDNKGVAREGIVFKNKTRDFSFKAISNEYLLKKG
jgi:RNA ligase (TIGR02306 family)